MGMTEAQALLKSLGETLEVAEAAEAFIMSHGFSWRPPPEAERLLKAISAWKGVPLVFGQDGEGYYGACQVDPPATDQTPR